MAVRVEGRRRFRMAQGSLYGHNVGAVGNQSAGKKMAAIVHLQAFESGRGTGLGPSVGDGVLMGRIFALSGGASPMGGPCQEGPWSIQLVARSRPG